MFTMNEDGVSFSNEVLKQRFPGHLHRKWPASAFGTNENFKHLSSAFWSGKVQTDYCIGSTTLHKRVDPFFKKTVDKMMRPE